MGIYTQSFLSLGILIKFLYLPVKVTVVPIPVTASVLLDAVIITIVMCCETGFHYLAHPDLELTILLPVPLKGWDYRHTSTCPDSILFFIQTEHRNLRVLTKIFIN